VTAVGATRFTNANVEIAADAFGSGGGFSWMFSRFEEQSASVEQHLKRAPLPPGGSYAGSGRGTPDVALVGEGYQVIRNGSLLSIGGTSASAPVFAALVSLLNDARSRHGRPSMGYLNPWIYANPDMFLDIVVGSNAINRYGFPVRYGFNCSRGWDPVTGLGSPMFDKMLQAALREARRDAIYV
jgi:tripeptidyl-peptidase-1